MRRKASNVITVSVMVMLASMPGCITGAVTNSSITMIGSGILFFAGYMGFIIGRYME